MVSAEIRTDNSANVRNLVHNSLLLQAQAQGKKFGFWEEVDYRLDKAIAEDLRLVNLLAATGTEGLSGTRSGSLLSILRYGLVPNSMQGTLPIPVITGEHATQPVPRSVVHLVHWLYAYGTKRYAEEASADGLSVHNYQQRLDTSNDFIAHIDPSLMYRTYFEKQKEAAQRFREWWESDLPTEQERSLHCKDFPVVVGVSLGGIPQESVEYVRTSVKGDCSVNVIIPPENITMLFVPEADRNYIQGHGESMVPARVCVESLESLRAMTEY